MPNLDNLKKSERTKETILQHALFLFERDGYDFVTMRELAKACEFSLGSFYYHFRNKEEIVLELFKSSLAGHLERSHAYLD